MKCDHLAMKRAVYGNRDDCLKCRAPIIYTGTRWIWEMELGMAKVRKMEQAYLIDRHTGKHS